MFGHVQEPEVGYRTIGWTIGRHVQNYELPTAERRHYFVEGCGLEGDGC